jgi:hypothetical protein
MSDITPIEQKKLEKIFAMDSGFILDFTNQKFQEFVSYSVGKSIYDGKYSINGESKAKRLRAFWQLESNQLVGKLIKDLLEYVLDMTGNIKDNSFNQCTEITNRLLQTTLLEIDLDSEKEFNVLIEAIKESVNKNIPEIGLDRLHTYAVKFIRKICHRRKIDIKNEKLEYKPLHSLMGEYVKCLENHGEVKSETTKKILKSSISIFDCFNHTRNNESYAHDNPVLNREESLLILKYVTETLAFIRIIEGRDNFLSDKNLPDKLRSQILVSDVVKKKVLLKQRNKEFIGLCPFHAEKTPSFIVNDQKEFYHCFGCSAHGDIISFLTSSEKIDHKSAIIKLVNDFQISY